jgi:hypothetical protein
MVSEYDLDLCIAALQRAAQRGPMWRCAFGERSMKEVGRPLKEQKKNVWQCLVERDVEVGMNYSR